MVWVDSGVSDGQGGLVSCGPWGQEETDTTEQLAWGMAFPEATKAGP